MAKTFCTNCGQELQADELFCPECGQPSPKDDPSKPADAKPSLPYLDQLRNLKLPQNWWVRGLGILLIVTGIAAILTRDSSEESATAETEVEQPASKKSTSSTPRRTVPPPVPKAEQPSPTGKWDAEVEVSPLDDTKTFYLDLDAEAGVWGPRGRSFTPRLTVMCTGEEFHTYVLIGMQAERERRPNLVTARLRFDDLEAETVSMVRSQEDDALFFREPREMVRRMRNHERLVFGFTPADSEIALTNFDLRGLEEAMQPIEEQCGWDEEEEKEEQETSQ